tara:strand:- start:863 stop:1024 length:162 start_codon:yes stop_codon:yes gene_type:complete
MKRNSVLEIALSINDSNLKYIDQLEIDIQILKLKLINPQTSDIKKQIQKLQQE